MACVGPDGPAFHAMVLTPDFFGGNASEISLPGARLLLGFAKAGLPTVVLGDWSAAVSTGHVSGQVNAKVAAAIAELLKQPTVLNVATGDQMPDALAQLGVTPRVSHASSTLKTLHRADGETDIYYVANARHSGKDKLALVSETVWLTAQARDVVPYQLDAWTGQISRIAQFTRQGSQVGVRMTLNPGQAAIVVLAAPGWAGEHGAVQVTATDGDEVFTDGDRVTVRAPEAGDYTATLADGTVLRV